MKSLIKTCDAHVHVTENGKWFNTSLDASVRALLNDMDKAQIDSALVLPIYGVTSNSFVKSCITLHGDRLMGFGCMSINTWQKDAQEIIDFGLRGVKFHPRIQHETITQWEEVGILKFLEKNNLPILVCGWQQTSSKIASMSEIHPIILDRIAKTYPNLKIIIAHLGGHHFLDAFFCARGNPNVFLDCSYFFEFFKGTSFASDAVIMLQKLGEKVLFGSDFPETSVNQYLKYFKKISENYQIDYASILSNNINKLFK